MSHIYMKSDIHPDWWYGWCIRVHYTDTSYYIYTDTLFIPQKKNIQTYFDSAFR